MAAVEVKITIPVKPFYRKIVDQDYGNPFKITTEQYAGKILLGFMRNSSANPKHFFGNDVIELIIPKFYFNQYNIGELTDEKISLFIEYLDKRFRDRLYSFMDGRLTLDEKINESKKVVSVKMSDAMRDFCKPYGIEEDEIPYEAYIKQYFRRRMSAKNQHYKGLKKKNNVSVRKTN